MTTKSIVNNHNLSQKPRLSLIKYMLIGTVAKLLTQTLRPNNANEL